MRQISFGMSFFYYASSTLVFLGHFFLQWTHAARCRTAHTINDGTIDLIEIRLGNLHHTDVNSSFRSRNLVSRVGQYILESLPRATRLTPPPPADAAPPDPRVRALLAPSAAVACRRGCTS